MFVGRGILCLRAGSPRWRIFSSDDHLLIELGVEDLPINPVVHNEECSSVSSVHDREYSSDDHLVIELGVEVLPVDGGYSSHNNLVDGAP